MFIPKMIIACFKQSLEAEVETLKVQVFRSLSCVDGQDCCHRLAFSGFYLDPSRVIPNVSRHKLKFYVYYTSSRMPRMNCLPQRLRLIYNYEDIIIETHSPMPITKIWMPASLARVASRLALCLS